MPLRVGNRWTYTIHSGLNSSVEDLRITESRSVADAPGFVLRGTFGTSLMAWRQNLLFADELPNTRFAPPLLLLDAAQPHGQRSWQGLVTVAGHSTQAAGTITQESERFTIAGRSYESIRVTHSLKVGGKALELITWYADGVGILKQEQSVNGIETRVMQYLSGP